MARASAHKRGYGTRWRKAREAYLHRNPLCVMCLEEGMTTQAEVVDHIIPHKGDTNLFWDIGNWQSLCKAHHDKAKQMMETGKARPGCTIDGIPLDSGHHWKG